MLRFENKANSLPDRQIWGEFFRFVFYLLKYDGQLSDSKSIFSGWLLGVFFLLKDQGNPV